MTDPKFISFLAVDALIAQEFDWCEKNRGVEGISDEFKRGFEAGLKQARNIIARAKDFCQMTTNSSTNAETDTRWAAIRKMRDKVHAEMDRVKAEIKSQGFSLVVVDDKTYRVS